MSDELRYDLPAYVTLPEGEELGGVAIIAGRRYLVTRSDLDRFRDFPSAAEVERMTVKLSQLLAKEPPHVAPSTALADVVRKALEGER